MVIQPSEQSFASGIELKCRRHGFRGVQSVGLGAIQQCWGLPVSYYDGHSCTASDLGTDPSNGLANVEPGDIVVHTVDGFNGNPALGIANILFTLPSGDNGMYQISGSVWVPDCSMAQLVRKIGNCWSMVSSKRRAC